MSSIIEPKIDSNIPKNRLLPEIAKERSISRNNRYMNTQQGHWILAKMGKRVLRPGGKELTMALIDALQINGKDDFVEFAPGMGYTARRVVAKNPKTYSGIELNQEAAARLQKKFGNSHQKIVVANAASTGLPSSSVDKVLGEAMLTMQIDKRKSEIIREAHRILKKGGLYGIHEMGLTPNDLPTTLKAHIQRELATQIKVNARPLTVHEWVKLVENEGFEIINVQTNGMLLMERSRILADEGLWRTLKIGFNVLTHPYARKRLLNMRRTFRKNQKNINAIAIVARKI